MNRPGVIAVVAGYFCLSHWLTTHAADQPWALAALVGPFWLLALVTAVRKRSAPALVALVLVAAGVAFSVSRGGVGDVHHLYLMDHVLIHLALCVSFAVTLRGGPGRLSLIEAIATRVHGSLTSDMAAYARRVTVAWVVYFMAMAVSSVFIFRLCTWETWALFANAATPLLLIAMFVGEHVMRYRLHPEFERASLMDSVRAYRRRSDKSDVGISGHGSVGAGVESRGAGEAAR